VQLLIHLRSRVHENERIGHLTLASIGAKYCENCGQLVSVLGRNHRCERHLSSQPSSPAPMTPSALLSPAPQTANTALADRTPAAPEPPWTPQPAQIELPAGPLHSLPKPCAPPWHPGQTRQPQQRPPRKRLSQALLPQPPQWS
jgi:hypothetical protein